MIDFMIRELDRQVADAPDDENGDRKVDHVGRDRGNSFYRCVFSEDCADNGNNKSRDDKEKGGFESRFVERRSVDADDFEDKGDDQCDARSKHDDHGYPKSKHGVIV